MNQLPLNKNELPLIREMLTKYKQGYISGLIPGSNITFSPSGCRNKIVSSTGGGGSSYILPYLKTGGASWSGTGLVYDVTALEYYFNGDKVTSATQVTLDASDPVNNRLDAIVVDESGVISVITGTAASSPITPPIPENQLLVQYILVEAGTTEPVIAKEDIYLENVEWTTSTYTTGTATGSIDFDNAVSPKQGVKCISANADARLGARFVRATSFDPYHYTMLSLWVRFTGSNVATNKSLNVRFENGAGTLVANTINLFNFGLQRNLLNVWQLVVIPITSFGVLPTSVKGLKIIMTGGTVGQARQWDIDLIPLTDNSVPSINEQAFNILKDGALVGQSSSLNFKGGSVNVTKDVTGGKIDIEVIGGGGSGGGENEDEVKSQLEEHSETSEYERVLSEIEGRANEKQSSTIFVDVTKFYKTTNFYFRKTDVRGLFMSSKLTIKNEKIMVILLDGKEYDCLFDEIIFEELKEFLNN